VAPNRILRDDQIASYRRDGFLVAPPPIVPMQEVHEVRTRTDLLCSDWVNLPKRRANGKGRKPSEERTISEILGAAVIDPDLGRLPLVQRCRTIACELLGVSRVWFHFDHVFYKQVGDESRVPWHQDRASSPTGLATKAVHFWIPLQDVSEANGCMRYIPGSQSRGLQDHRVAARSDGVVIRSTVVDEREAKACPVAVGGLICHTPMTLHASGPNLSQDIRRAWVLQMGVGPWVALRQTVRPIQSAYARAQVTAARRRFLTPAS